MNRIGKQQQARIEQWLAKEKHSEQELAEGALMVLQCNRNRAMYNTITRRLLHFEEKITYELRKHVRYMEDGLVLDDVKALDARVLPAIGQAIAKTDAAADGEKEVLPLPVYSKRDGRQTDVIAKGKRADHDSLPPHIQDIWEKNAQRWKKMKQAHETCRTLTAACDRYEYTKAIAELWAEYKKDFETYDNYNAGQQEENPSGTDRFSNLTAMDMQAIKLARAYVAKNLPKLEKLVKASKRDGFTEEQRSSMYQWRFRIQERINLLVETRQVMSDDYKVRLAKAGIETEAPSAYGEGQEHIDDTPAAE